MAKIRTSELRGPALDWVVAKAKNIEVVNYGMLHTREDMDTCEFVPVWSPSTDWAQGGPIIEREKIQLLPSITGGEEPWHSSNPANDYVSHQYGPTPLISAMRCFVASKLGDYVEVPDDVLGLLSQTHRKQIQEGAKSNSVNQYLTGPVSGDDDSEEESDLPAPRG